MASQPPASAGYGGASLLDLSKYPSAQEFVARCHEFFREVKDLYVSIFLIANSCVVCQHPCTSAKVRPKAVIISLRCFYQLVVIWRTKL